MGKHSNFERNERDYYPTPEEAVLPLLPVISANPRYPQTFIEPCAGDGRLIRHLRKYGLICNYACDIQPQAENIHERDVLFFEGDPLPSADYIITNPPWGRGSLHPMIDRFRRHAPTWLLIDAGWAYTKQAKPYMAYCHSIVAIGRVKWMENTKMGGKEDCAWYNFKAAANPGHIRFYGA